MAELSAEVTENYLKEIYHLSLDHKTVKTSVLAEALQVSAAAVTEMLKRLEQQKLVSYRRYQGASLTKRGRKRALLVVRRHRLWEVFLHDVLGFAWHELHEHAERLEHATDGVLASRLEAFLGNPARDPHGHPIPDAEGNVDEGDRIRLTSLPTGSKATIDQCAHDNPELLDYLAKLGLVPGAEVEVHDRAPFSGPLSLTVGGEQVSISVEAARTLMVTPLE